MQSRDVPATPSPTRQPEATTGAAPRHRWGLFHLMTVLFLVFQVSAALTLRPGGHFNDASDTGYYATWGLLSYRGLYPYLDYWVEYPPVVPWLAVFVFRLTAWLPKGDVWGLSDLWFRLAMACISALASTGSLVMVYRLARVCWRGERCALRAAMAYALAFVPLFVTLGYMDLLPVFLLLLALDLTVRQRSTAGGVVAGLGFLTKLYPAVVGLAALRTRGRWKWVAACLGTIAVGLAPFAILSPRFLLASAQAMLSRHSWETVWALLRGYYSYGTLAGDHFDASAQQGASHGLAYYLCLAAVAAVTLALYWRTRRAGGERQSVALTGFAVTALLLAYSGYSPQFAVWLVPFVAILLPNRRGVLYLVGLSIVMLAERMLYFTVLPESHSLLTAIVVTRSLLYLALTLEMLAFLLPTHSWRLPRPAQRYVGAAVLVLVPVLLLVGSAWTLNTQMLPRYRVLNRMAAVLDAMEAMGTDSGGVIVTSDEAFALVRPYLGGRQPFLLTFEDYQSPARWRSVSAKLQQFVASQAQVWLFLDESVAFNADLNRDVRQGTAASGYVCYQRWFDYGVWAGLYAMGEPERWRQGPAAEFAGGLRLDEVAIADGDLAAGDAVRLRLGWRTTADPEGDLTAFVHVMGDDGRLAAQSDVPLGDTAWVPDAAGAASEQRLAVSLPDGLAPGPYSLVMGVYRAGSGERLALVGGGDSLDLGTVNVAGAIG